MYLYGYTVLLLLDFYYMLTNRLLEEILSTPGNLVSLQMATFCQGCHLKLFPTIFFPVNGLYLQHGNYKNAIWIIHGKN